MNRCEDIQALLNDWLDDVLDSSENERIDAHLRTCDACRVVFERHASIANDLTTLGLFADRIATREVAPRRIVPRWVRWRTGLAAVAVLLLGLSLALTELRRGDAPPTLPQGNPDETGVVDAVAALESDFSMTTPTEKMAVQRPSSNPRIHIVWLYDEVSSDEDSSPNTQDPSENPPT